MTQRPLFQPERETRIAKILGHDERNLATARYIISDEKRWTAECVLLVIWAKRVIARLTPARIEEAA